MELKKINDDDFEFDSYFSLVYLEGSKDIDKIIENHYAGEEFFIQCTFNNDYLSLNFGKHVIELKLCEIMDFKFDYDYGQIVISYFSDLITFSFEDKINFHFLSFLNIFNKVSNLPEFLKSRFLCYSDEEILILFNQLRQVIRFNEAMFFADELSESQYYSICNSFAKPALCEIPLVYIPYRNTGEDELGLLITSEQIYCPTGQIDLKDIFSVSYHEKNNLVNTRANLILSKDLLDYVVLNFNDIDFTIMKLITNDKSMLSINGMKRIFFPDDLLKIILELSQYKRQKTEQSLFSFLD